MSVGISDISASLKKVILPYVRDNFPSQTILLDQVKRNVGTQFMNDTFYVPLRTSRQGGVTNLANDKSKLLSGQATTGQASAAVKIVTGTFEITKLAIAASKNQKGAIEPALQFQAEALLSDFSRSVNRQFMGDGSGVIAKIVSPGTATPSGTAIPVQSVNQVNGDIPAVNYISPGMVLKFGTAVGTVASVVDAGTVGTVNLTGSISYGSADTNIVHVDGDLNVAAETSGLDEMIAASGTYQGLARATTPQWAAQVGTLAGGTLTERGMQLKHLAAAKYAMTGDRYAIFMNQTPYASYGNLLTAMRREVSTRELIGGWSGLEFQTGQKPVGVFLDYDTPEGRVMGVNLDSLTVGEVAPMEWEEDPTSGQPILRVVDYIKYQAVMTYFVQMLGLGPASNWKLTDILA